MPKIIIGFTGLMASGKEVSKKYLEEKYGAKSFRFSTVMREILQRLDLEITRYNLVNISYCLRQTFGEDLFAKVMAKDVATETASLVVVDGIRRLADIEYLKKVPGFTLASIEATPEIRHARLVKRAENEGDAQKTFAQFQLDQQQLETEISIPGVMAEAKFRINNDRDFDTLYRQLDGIIAQIKK